MLPVPSLWNRHASQCTHPEASAGASQPQGTWAPLYPSQHSLSVSFLRWCGHPPTGWAVPSTPVAASASGAALGTRQCTWSAITLLSKCSVGTEGDLGQEGGY